YLSCLTILLSPTLRPSSTFPSPVLHPSARGGPFPCFLISRRYAGLPTLHSFPTRRSSDLRLNVDGMNIISNDGSNKLNRSRKARVSYKVQRTINASLNAATSTRAVSSNPNFVTRQKIEIIFG